MEKGMHIPLKRYWTLLVDYVRPQWPRVVLLAVLLLAVQNSYHKRLFR